MMFYLVSMCWKKLGLYVRLFMLYTREMEKDLVSEGVLENTLMGRVEQLLCLYQRNLQTSIQEFAVVDGDV